MSELIVLPAAANRSFFLRHPRNSSALVFATVAAITTMPIVSVALVAQTAGQIPFVLGLAIVSAGIAGFVFGRRLSPASDSPLTDGSSEFGPSRTRYAFVEGLLAAVLAHAIAITLQTLIADLNYPGIWRATLQGALLLNGFMAIFTVPIGGITGQLLYLHRYRLLTAPPQRSAKVLGCGTAHTISISQKESMRNE